jgi:hypothetical protein
LSGFKLFPVVFIEQALDYKETQSSQLC